MVDREVAIQKLELGISKEHDYIVPASDMKLAAGKKSRGLFLFSGLRESNTVDHTVTRLIQMLSKIKFRININLKSCNPVNKIKRRCNRYNAEG